MKIKITLKDPDGVYECIRQDVESHVESIEGLDAEEREELLESRTDSVNDKLSKWIEYGEYVTVEFDAETGEAKVIPV